LKYVTKTKPYEHQKTALQDLWDREYLGVFWEMGTGKSKLVIDQLGKLYEEKRIDTVLIFAPKGVYDNWAREEIPLHLPDRIKYRLVRWQPNLSEKFKNEMRDVVYRKNREPDTLHILIMNVESMSTSKGANTAFLYLKENPDNIMIVDESTTIKNRTALRTKNVIKASRLAKYRRILTGSPVTKSPLDLFSQCECLSPEALNFKSYYAFRNRYATVQQRNMGTKSFQEVVGYRRLDELNTKLDTFSTRILKEDCLDLPSKTYVRRDVPLTTEQKEMYRQMKRLALAQFESGELATTASVLTQIMRLQQICCGWLRPDEGEPEDIPNNRLSELMAVTDEVQGKVIIWCSWTRDIHRIATALRHRFGNEAVALYFGETPQKDRQEIIKRFQDPDSGLRFFVGQPKTGGFGITLTAAHTMIYFSNSYDLEIRIQSEDRVHRIGQEKPVTYVDLVSPNTIDEKILQALREKIDISSEVLGEKARSWLI